MSDFDLSRFSSRDFEHLVQALAIKVIGPGIRIFGDGPDGAREATFEGKMPMYPVSGGGWDGYLVVQSKHCQRPTGDTGKDGAWALAELNKEIAKFSDVRRNLRRPDYYIFVTNVVLTPVSEVGAQDRLFEALRTAAPGLSLKGFDIWDYDRICRFLDSHDSVRQSYAHLLTSGDVLSQLQTKLTQIERIPSQLDFIVSSFQASEISRVQGVSTDGQSTDDAKAEIDRIGKYMERGQLDVASELLDEVEKTFGSRLSKRAHYRIAANRGHIKRLRGDSSGAAQLYLEAKQYQPDDQDARFLEALAFLLTGRTQDALQLATALKRDVPAFARASLVEIMAAPPESRYEQLNAGVPSTHRDNAEVMAALSRRALLEGNLATAEKDARRALELGPNFIEPMLLLAETIVEDAFGDGGWVDLIATESDVVARLREAETLYDKALQISAQMDPLFRAKIRIDRAAVFDALGEQERVRSELLSVFRDFPNFPDAVLRYAATLAGENRVAEAIVAAEPAVAQSDCSPNLILLYVQLIAERNQPGDRQRACQLLKSRAGEWPTYPKAFRISWFQTFTQVVMVVEGHGAARDALEQLPDDAMPREMCLALRAWVEQVGGDEEKASSLADEAVLAVTPGSRIADVRRVALVLYKINKPDKALPLWQRVVTPSRLTTDTRLLLQCAERCGDDDTVLQVCAQLREHGHLDPQCLDLEIATLGRRSPQTAAQVIRELLAGPAVDSTKRLLRLRLSHIGLYTKQPDLVEKDVNALPSVSEANAQLGRAVVGVLIQSDLGAATEYAYELYRRFPDDFDAHMAVIESYGPWLDHDKLKILEPRFVSPGCAVCIQHLGSRRREWWIIENGSQPSLGRGERAPDDPAVQQMLGKAKGDTFVFRTDPVPAEAKIIRIDDKFVYRWRDCFMGMESRFPQKTPIWSINVKKRGKYDFTSFLRQLDQQAQKAKERDEWYKTNPVPLAMFADIIGKSVLEAGMYVAETPGLPFRCCSGLQQDYDAAMAVVDDCTRIVIDGSALTTLFLTGTSGWLDKMPVECAVTEHTLYKFRRIELINRPADKELAQIGKAGDQYVHTISKPEQLLPLRARIENFIRDVESHCEVVSGASLAPLPLDQQEGLVQSLGRDVVESMVTAANPNTILWTDDVVVADLAKFSLKVRRTWTQAVFGWLGGSGVVGEEVNQRLAADLIYFGYAWTRLSARDVLLAGREAGWDVDNTRFAATMGQLGLQEAGAPGLITFVGEIFKGIFQGGLPKLQEDAVAFRVLKLLDSRPNGRLLMEAVFKNILALFQGDL